MAEANTQYIEVPIPLGVDTAMQPELVPPGKALSIRNCHVGNGALVERRQFSALGREAYVEASAAVNHGEVRAILPLGDGVMIATEESKLYKRHEADDVWTEIQCNDAPVSFKQALYSGPAVSTDVGVEGAAPGERARNPNCALLGDYLCVTYWQAQGVVPGEEGGTQATGVAIIYNLATKVVHHVSRVIVSLPGVLGCTSETGLGSNPSLIPVAVGTHFFVLWIDTVSNEIKYRSIDPTDCRSTDWSPTVTTFSSQLAPDTFDAYSDGTQLFVVSNSATHVVLRRATAAAGVLTVTHTVNQWTGVAYAVSVHANADRVFMAWVDNSGGAIYAAAANPADASVATLGTATEIAAAGTATVTEQQQVTCHVHSVLIPGLGGLFMGTVAWGKIETSGVTKMTVREVFVSNLVSEAPMSSDGAFQHDLLGVSISHRPFRLSDDAPGGLAMFFGVRVTKDLDSAYYTYSAGLIPSASLDIQRVVTPVARYSALVAAAPYGTDEGIDVREAGACAVVEHGGRYHWVGVERVPLYDVGAGTGNPADGLGVTRDTVHVYSLDFSSERCWSHVVVNGQTMVAGSVPRIVQPETMAADDEIVPRGMIGTAPLHTPYDADISGSATVGALDTAATYHYRFAYEYIDMHGRVHRGAPSEDYEVTLGGGQSSANISLVGFAPPMPGYRITKLVIFRTEGNPPELIYYRLAELSETLTYAGATSYVDTTADAEIVNNPVLYTVSGELVNFPPPPSLALCLWKNRIVALDSETGAIWPSKTIIDGEWPGFNEGLAVSTAVHTSLPVYLSEDTDNLIVWWRDAIGVSYGEPGSDTGAPGSLTQPRLLGQRGVGLKYVKSLVRTEVGHMFMSDHGIYLLGPDMGLSYIGEPVAAYNNHVIVGARVVKTPLGSLEVRFETQGDEAFYGDGYVTLVYDLMKQSWHVHTRGRKPLASAVIGERYYLATEASGTDDPWTGDGEPDASGVWLESTSTALNNVDAADPSGTYVATLDTAWLAFAGKIGATRARRLWLLGDFYSTLPITGAVPANERPTTIVAYRDYVLAAEQALVRSTQNANMRIIEADFDRQELTALRLRISGFQRLIAMRIEVEAEKGALRRNNVLGA